MTILIQNNPINIPYNLLSILPRDYQNIASTEVLFTNEDTKEITTVTPFGICDKSNNLNIVIHEDSFVEGERYTFEVRQFSTDLKYNEDTRDWCESDAGVRDTIVIFKGTALVTNFKDKDYTMNSEEFNVDTDTDSSIMKVYE